MSIESKNTAGQNYQKNLRSSDNSEECKSSDNQHYGEFKCFLKNVLTSAPNIPKADLDYLTNDENIQLFEQAFTHRSVNSLSNYDKMEFIGDGLVNFCTIDYIRRNYMQYDLSIIARVKMSYISKKWLPRFADEFGFWPYIKAGEHTSKKKLLEDVFESFFGVTMHLLDKKYRPDAKFGQRVGYDVCQRIIDNLLEYGSNQISIEYDELFDAKTRLKELFDALRHAQPTYCDNEPNHTHKPVVFESICTVEREGRSYELGCGRGESKADAQQDAAKRALDTMKKEFRTERIMRLNGTEYECTLKVDGIVRPRGRRIADA